MKRNFIKMHGIGNDYIYFDCLKDCIKEPQKAAIALSDRHFSIGGDGMVMICPSHVCDAKMRMFNADGSEGKMCGNAIRCVGKLLYENLGVKKDIITVETLGGNKTLHLNIADGTVESVLVDMGKASFAPCDIPILCDREMINAEHEIGGKIWRTTALSMGNPHAVTFVDNVKEFPLEEEGPLFENSPLFPEKVNAEFARIADKNKIEMRVWERGSGETLACGTGACAVAAAAVKLGLADANADISVLLMGGTLTIRISDDFSVTMNGPCEISYTGTVENEYL